MYPFQKILCPTDLSEPSFRALMQAAQLASHCGGELVLLQVLSASAGNSEVETAQRDLQDLQRDHFSDELKASALVRQGDATAEIVRAAREENADLILLATQGSSTGWREYVLGSVAGEVVRLAPCPVLTLNKEALQDAK